MVVITFKEYQRADRLGTMLRATTNSEL